MIQSNIGNSITAKQTHYALWLYREYLKDSNFYDACLYTDGDYWLATRTMLCYNSYCSFSLMKIWKWQVDAAPMYYSTGGYARDYKFQISPVASLGASLKYVRQTNGSWNVSK